MRNERLYSESEKSGKKPTRTLSVPCRNPAGALSVPCQYPASTLSVPYQYLASTVLSLLYYLQGYIIILDKVSVSAESCNSGRQQ